MNAIDILIIGSLIATATWTISFLIGGIKDDIIEEIRKENKKDETD